MTTTLSVMSVALVAGISYLAPSLQDQTIAVCAGLVATGSVSASRVQEKLLTQQEVKEDTRELLKSQNLRTNILLGIIVATTMIIGEEMPSRTISVSAFMGVLLFSHYLKAKVIKENTSSIDMV